MGLVLALIFTLLIAYMICGILYLQFGCFKKLYHDFLGHHVMDEKTVRKARNIHAFYGYCKYCGKRMVEEDYSYEQRV